MISTGDKVFLKACRAGDPGTVIREERGKFTVYWKDLDYWSKHRAESLELASAQNMEPNKPIEWDEEGEVMSVKLAQAEGGKI